MSEAVATFRERLDALVGRPLGGGVLAPDRVNLPMIRHWVAAFDDRNPAYLDADAAIAAGHPDVVAPPMMLQTWTMLTPVLEGIAERGGAPTPTTEESVIDVFDQVGFTGTLATLSEIEIERYLRVGELVTSANVLESVSEEKQTRAGPGHFVTWLTTFLDEDGEVVGRQRFGILKFRPSEAGT